MLYALAINIRVSYCEAPVYSEATDCDSVGCNDVSWILVSKCLLLHDLHLNSSVWSPDSFPCSHVVGRTAVAGLHLNIYPFVLVG